MAKILSQSMAKILSQSVQTLIALAFFWMLLANFSFYSALLHDYPFEGKNILFLVSIFVGFISVLIIALCLLLHKHTFKPLAIVLLMVTSFSAYFMDSYNILIDDFMIGNIVETDTAEALDLFSYKLILYVLFLGIIPSIFIYKKTITFNSFQQELLSRFKLIAILLLITLGLYLVQSAKMSSFFREHKSVRYYFNPANYVFGLGRYVHKSIKGLDNRPISVIAQDAHFEKTTPERHLIIMVVGETARADHFSLNGYKKETNPLLKKQHVISFSNVTSCATLTALSVPCMFSGLGIDNFSVDKAKHQENILDVFKRLGVNVLWRDNNSSSKGVADRVLYQDYRNSDMNHICDDECRDEGMLDGLQDYIISKPNGDIVIVLHQMGSHGPAYYKRYPREFEKFKPVCHTNELSDCDDKAISNTYDNTILYTDYFLNRTIDFLKENANNFETTLFYISDHGESLGENGLYLHGMPNFIAPNSQRKVPMIMWSETNYNHLINKKDTALSHDSVFHTMFGLLHIKAKIYDKNLDLLRD